MMSLKERREIVALAAGADAGVMVTLVRAAGSSYRQPGAHLLVLPDGRTAGTISGGCLEADLLRRAQWRVRAGAVMQTYDTGFDDLAEIPFGLGCGGAVDLLLENFGTPEAKALGDALAASLAGEERTVVTLLPAGDMAAKLHRIVLDARGDVLFASEHTATEAVVPMRRAGLFPEEPSANLFVERLAPAQRLVIFGAGEDAKPLARIAREIGWTVVVADGRPQQARTERFPEAHAVVVARTVADAAAMASDAFVLMTHSFEQDRMFLTELLPLQPRYLGLLGARHRSALLLRHACDAAGITLAEGVARVHAPVGLELGGDGPESIALAIAAEIQLALQSTARSGEAAQRRMSLAVAERCLQQFGASPQNLPAAMCALDGSSALSAIASAEDAPHGAGLLQADAGLLQADAEPLPATEPPHPVVVVLA